MARALIRGLRARGINLSTSEEAGLLGATDEEQLEFASSQGRVFYTFNVSDFCRLHSLYLESERSHAGIVVVPRQRYSIGEQIRGLAKLTATSTAEEMADRLVFLRV